MPNEPQAAAELARLYGVQTSYVSATGQPTVARPEALLAVLKALGAEVESAADFPAALAARRRHLAARRLPPVCVAWDGQAAAVELPLATAGRLACRIRLESGAESTLAVDAGSLPVGPSAAQGGVPVRRLALPGGLPLGYHRLELEAGGRSESALLISAPVASYLPSWRRMWGLFLPLYALRSAESWCCGDFSGLGAMTEWITGQGGGVVSTLPLLASFLDEPFEPSPYAPASRLFWNELYVDPRALPEASHPAVRSLLESAETAAEIAALEGASRVDYRRLAALKGRVFREMAAAFFRDSGSPAGHRADFDVFLASRPDLPDYAAFRAVGDRRRQPWQVWPGELREGRITAADFDEDDRRYHLWCQWAADRQLRAVAGRAREQGAGLYLDLPLGVHGSAYDVYRERDLFASRVSAGAPPDALFTGGQDWGFPPMVPERLRERGYDHLIACLRHSMQHAGVLRVDHVMQLHRLYWVPEGFPAMDGVYVTYPAEELYAILCLESHRHQTLVVGENLGTVPPEVDAAMERHDLSGLFILQFEVGPDGRLRRQPPERSVASFNTHDMPTFRGFWEGRDIGHLERLGYLTPKQADADRERRRQVIEAMAWTLPGGRPEGDAFAAVLVDRLRELAASPARAVLINLEDLWGEAEPQNVPGTHREMPNWQRKAHFSLEELADHQGLCEVFSQVDELRRKGQG